MLNTENKIWLENSATAMRVKPESLLNAIIRQMRTNFGLIGNQESLEDWMEKSRRVENELLISLAETRTALRLTQETAKATQLYLNQIQGTANLTQSKKQT